MAAVGVATVMSCLNGVGIFPMMGFDVSIGKSHRPKVRMFNARPVPEPTGVTHEQHETGVTDVEWRGINESVNTAWIDWSKIASLAESITETAVLIIVVRVVPGKV